MLIRTSLCCLYTHLYNIYIYANLKEILQVQSSCIVESSKDTMVVIVCMKNYVKRTEEIWNTNGWELLKLVYGKKYWTLLREEG